MPYPTPADRKDLESLVKDNWQQKVVDPLAASGDKTSDHFGNAKDWIFDRCATVSELHLIIVNLNLAGPSRP